MAAGPASAEYFKDSVAIRAAIRCDRIATRLALANDPERHGALSTRIERHLANWFATLPPATFAFCTAIRGEFDVMPLATQLVGQGWHASIAVAPGPASALIFRHWIPQTPLTADQFGIPVPQTAEVAAPEILLIPLVAVDGHGFRLGYGGGYFDRTLASKVPRPLAVGIGFELARVDSVLPQEHDQPMDLVITETGLQHLRRP